MTPVNGLWPRPPCHTRVCVHWIGNHLIIIIFKFNCALLFYFFDDILLIMPLGSASLSRFAWAINQATNRFGHWMPNRLKRRDVLPMKTDMHIYRYIYVRYIYIYRFVWRMFTTCLWLETNKRWLFGGRNRRFFIVMRVYMECLHRLHWLSLQYS